MLDIRLKSPVSRVAVKHFGWHQQLFLALKIVGCSTGTEPRVIHIGKMHDWKLQALASMDGHQPHCVNRGCLGRKCSVNALLDAAAHILAGEKLGERCLAR
ncbi:hypothetical protein D9M70_544610 [compost metagenome]